MYVTWQIGAECGIRSGVYVSCCRFAEGRPRNLGNGSSWRRRDSEFSILTYCSWEQFACRSHGHRPDPRCVRGGPPRGGCCASNWSAVRDICSCLGVTVIETALIVSVMLAAPAESAALPRDTIFAVVMIVAVVCCGAECVTTNRPFSCRQPAPSWRS